MKQPDVPKSFIRLPNEQRMVHGGWSGGGTKFAGLLAAGRAFHQHNVHFDIVSGVSSGSIVAILWAAGQIMNPKVIETALNLNLKTFFWNPPLTKKGNLSLYAIKQILTKKPNLGDQTKLIYQLDRFISEDDWQRYNDLSSSPDCWVGQVDFVSGSRRIVNLKGMDRIEAFTEVLAASSIPVWTAGVHNNGMILYDGGNRDHCITAAMFEKYKDRISGSLSVYSRPQDHVLPRYEEKAASGVLMRSIDIFNVEVSKSDEKIEKLLADKYNIDHRIVYLPSVMKNPYDTSPENLKTLYTSGRDNAITTLSNG